MIAKPAASAVGTRGWNQRGTRALGQEGKFGKGWEVWICSSDRCPIFDITPGEELQPWFLGVEDWFF